MTNLSAKSADLQQTARFSGKNRTATAADADDNKAADEALLMLMRKKNIAE